MVKPLSQADTEAIAHLVNAIPGCAGRVETGILVCIRGKQPLPDGDWYYVDAGCDAHECGWRIESIQQAFRFFTDHATLLDEVERDQ